MCGSWEGTEGIPFLCTGEEPRGRRDEESDVLGTGGTRTSFPLSRCIIMEDGGGRGRLDSSSSFPFFFSFLFFPDASTMEEMTTSPNKKSGNKLHWIRMLGWMDASRVV